MKFSLCHTKLRSNLLNNNPIRKPLPNISTLLFTAISINVIRPKHKDKAEKLYGQKKKRATARAEY